jgi:hypothetical protein
MAANTNPIFVLTPNVKQGQATTANTSRDGTGTLATLNATGANASILTKVVVEVPGTSVADVIRLFWSDGTNTRLYQEILVSAVTPSTTVACFRTEYIPSTPEAYPSGWTLKCSTNQGQTTNVTGFMGDF